MMLHFPLLFQCLLFSTSVTALQRGVHLKYLFISLLAFAFDLVVERMMLCLQNHFSDFSTNYSHNSSKSSSVSSSLVLPGTLLFSNDAAFALASYTAFTFTSSVTAIIPNVSCNGFPLFLLLECHMPLLFS